MQTMLSNVLNACAVFLSLTTIFAGLGRPDARPGAPYSVAVNRTLKNDRLTPVKQSLQNNDLPVPVANRSLVDGCESAVSPLSYSPLAQIAGRCLS